MNAACDMSHMAVLDGITAELRLRVEREGLTPLSRRLGVPLSMLRSFIDGRDPRISSVEAMAAALGRNISIESDLIAPLAQQNYLPQISLVGFAGAGSTVSYDSGLAGDEHVKSPPDLRPGLVAIEVRGRSMEPAVRAGDRVYFRHGRPFDPEDCVGRMVIATTDDGATYVKLLRRGDEPGTWNLESVGLNETTMENVRLDRVAPVEWIACRGRFQAPPRAPAAAPDRRSASRTGNR